MDGSQQQTAKARNWAWLPEHMPGVQRLMREKRRELGDAWVNECWKRGVVQREPGWFFASEGTLSVGVLEDHPAMIALATARITSTQAFLMLREKGSSNGA